MRLILATLALIISTSHAQTDQQLVDRYDKFIAVENYTAAHKAAKTIVERYPESATWNYNLGATNALLKNTEAALESLQTSADLGYTGIRTFEQSTELDSLRENDRFIKILAQVKRNADARLNKYIQQAKNHKPKTHIPKSIPESPPLIIALHGTGMQGDDMLKALQSTADQLNMILIAPDALRPAGNGGFSWTYRDESEWMVNHTIETAIEKHNIDPAQIYLVGFSQGANIALIMGQTQPDTFAGVIPICGHYQPQNASAEANATLPPFYLLTGARDPWKKTYAQAKRDFTKSNAKVQVRMLTGKGHQLPNEKELTKAIKWCQSQY